MRGADVLAAAGAAVAAASGAWVHASTGSVVDVGDAPQQIALVAGDHEGALGVRLSTAGALARDLQDVLVGREHDVVAAAGAFAAAVAVVVPNAGDACLLHGGGGSLVAHRHYRARNVGLVGDVQARALRIELRATADAGVGRAQRQRLLHTRRLFGHRPVQIEQALGVGVEAHVVQAALAKLGPLPLLRELGERVDRVPVDVCLLGRLGQVVVDALDRLLVALRGYANDLIGALVHDPRPITEVLVIGLGVLHAVDLGGCRHDRGHLVLPRHRLLIREVEPVAVDLRALARADLAEVELVEVMRRAVIGIDGAALGLGDHQRALDVLSHPTSPSASCARAASRVRVAPRARSSRAPAMPWSSSGRPPASGLPPAGSPAVRGRGSRLP